MKIEKKFEKFEQVFKETSSEIYKFLFSLIGNAETAEEITQEAFIKMYMKIDDILFIDNHRAWLYRVASNIALNFLKREKNYNRLISKYFSKSESISCHRGSKQENELLKDEEILLLRQYLSQLSKKEQLIVILYQQGFSYSEMSHITGTKKSSIGVTISRAISKMEKKFKKGV